MNTSEQTNQPMVEEHSSQELQSWSLLRSLLLEPYAENWSKIGQLLCSKPSSARREMVDYVRNHLDSWPRHLRHYPRISFEELYRQSREWPYFHLGLTLNLNGKEMDAERARKLAWLKHIQPLEELHLSSNPLRDEGLYWILQAPFVRELTTLILGWCELSSVAMEHLSSATFLSSVRHLDLYSNPIGSQGALHLANSEHLHSLLTLDLGNCRIGNGGLYELARVSWNCLHSLSLFDNQLDCDGLTALADSASLRDLTELYLNQNQIRNTGVSALANSPNVANLVTLHLNRNMIGDDGARALVNSPHLRDEVHLRLSYNRISDPVKEAVLARFKNATL